MQVSVQLRKGKNLHTESSESRVVYGDDHCHGHHADRFTNTYVRSKNVKEQVDARLIERTPKAASATTKASTSVKSQRKQIGVSAGKLNQSHRVETPHAADTTKDYSRASISAYSNPYKNVMNNTTVLIEEEDETSPVFIEHTKKDIIRTKRSVPNLQPKKKLRKNAELAKVDRTMNASDVLSRSLIISEHGLTEFKPAVVKKRASVFTKDLPRTKSANYLGLTSSFRGKALTAAETGRAVPAK